MPIVELACNVCELHVSYLSCALGSHNTCVSPLCKSMSIACIFAAQLHLCSRKWVSSSARITCRSFPILLRPQLAQDTECMPCLPGFYPEECSGGSCASDNDPGSGSGMSGSGSGVSQSGSGDTEDLQLFGCAPCHPSCLECFGPLSTQCYQCANLSLLLQEPTSSDPANVSACDATNTSRAVVQCVEECPPGSTIEAGSQQCTCLQGKYQNGSDCLNCSSNCSTCVNGTESGCLTCSSYSYENSCVADCPSQTLPNDDDECVPVKDT